VASPATPQSGEDRLIARYFRPLARHPGALALSDDAAVFSPPAGTDILLKTDAIVGGVHFLPDDPAGDIARKALRVNLSDLAAKGGEPAGFLLSLVLPKGVPEHWLADFSAGLKADAETYRCPLMGGDTDHTPGPITISIAAIGILPHGSMVKRRGARAGDRVFVSGTIGDAALGLRLRRGAAEVAAWKLDAAERDHLVGRYRLPQPRGAIAGILRRHASAAMDVSDGLAGDFAKLCAVSGVSGAVEAAQVPLSDPARKALASDASLISAILGGGDDYEIIATVPKEKAEAFRRDCAGVGVAVGDIGEITEGQEPPQFLGRNRKPIELERLSYTHF
jgi:thiamine-monophosphate kinase